jgi:hypothetical protein
MNKRPLATLKMYWDALKALSVWADSVASSPPHFPSRSPLYYKTLRLVQLDRMIRR